MRGGRYVLVAGYTIVGSVEIVGLDRWREESSTEECLGLEMYLA